MKIVVIRFLFNLRDELNGVYCEYFAIIYHVIMACTAIVTYFQVYFVAEKVRHCNCVIALDDISRTLGPCQAGGELIS